MDQNFLEFIDHQCMLFKCGRSEYIQMLIDAEMQNPRRVFEKVAIKRCILEDEQDLAKDQDKEKRDKEEQGEKVSCEQNTPKEPQCTLGEASPGDQKQEIECATV